jgi:ketosteroid isomerase-like protein
VGEPSDVVRAWVEACNERDVEAALSLCDREIVLREADTLPGSVLAEGTDQVRRYLERFQTHWSDGRWEPIELREQGDHVFMPARLRLVGRKSGIEVDRVWIYVFTVRDGKLLRQDGYDDPAEGLRAAGIEDQPAE